MSAEPMDENRLTEAERQVAAWTAAAAAASAAAERVKAAARAVEAIASVATAVAHEVELERVVSAVLNQTTRVLGAHAAAVHLAVEERGELQLVGQRGLPADLAARLARVSFDAPLLAARAASTRQVQLVEDSAALDPGLTLVREVLSRTESRSALSVPLVAFGRLVGVSTYNLPEPHHFPPEDLATMGVVAEIFAVGLANARTFEAERRLRTQLEAASRAALAISGESDLRAVLQTIVDQARLVAGAEYAALGVGTDPAGPFDPWVSSGLSLEQIAPIGRVPSPIGLLGLVARERRAVRAADVRQHPAFTGFPPRHPDITGFLGVPIRYPARGVGNLYLGNKLGEPEFTEEDQRAIELLAAHAGVALQQAHLRETVEAERARLQTILESAPHGILFVDAETRSPTVNPAINQLLGRTSVPHAGLAQYVGLICRPDGRPLTLEELPSTRALRGETLRDEELLVARPDDRRIPILSSATPVRDASGGVTGAVVIVQDIAARKRAEEALRASEERFRLLAERSQDILFRCRLMPTFSVEYLSPAVTTVLGYAPEQFYADPDLPFKLVHPESRPLFEAVVQSPALLAGQPFTLRWRREDGGLVWTEQRAIPIPDEAGNLVAVEGVARDITARKRVEEERARLLEELAAERSRLQTIVESSPVGIICVEDAAGERVLANRHAEELFGHPLPPEGGLAQYVGQVCAPDGRPLAYEELPAVRALRGELIVGEELLVRQLDGQEIPVLQNAQPMRNAAGNVVGAVVVCEDITFMKEVERLREEWTSVVAHDLRQPVTVITGYAGLLAKKAADQAGPIKAQAEHILASARLLSRMIGDLLDVSRIEARRLRLERRVVDLPALVRAVVERTAEVTKGQSIRVDVKGAIPPLEADPGRLDQVLTNLLSNAAKYSDPDSEILVEVERPDGEVQVAVTNWGPGIAPEELPRLFSRFYRTRRTQAERVAGLGLGLYITRGLIEAHGGRIWVESLPGQTTTFRFTLPV